MPSGEAWKVLRVVVEVKVPPRTPATDKDLIWAIQQALPASVELPRPHHPRRQTGAIRVKSFDKFWPAFARLAGWRKPATIRVPMDEL